MQIKLCKSHNRHLQVRYLLFVYLLDEGGGDVCGGYEADAGQGDDNSLLAGDAGNAAFNAKERTVDNSNHIATLEMTV